MGISKREIVVVGALLAVLTAGLVYQWRFNPNTCWWRLERERRVLVKMERENENSRVISSSMGMGGYERFLSLAPNHPKAEAVQVLHRQAQTMLAAYQEFVRRYPDHPKAAAARVLIVWLEERLTCGNPHILEVQSEVMKFYDNQQAAIEVEKILRESSLSGIAAESLACISPRTFATGRAADAIVQQGWIFAQDSTSGKTFGLPFPDHVAPDLIADSTLWRSDLGQVAFVTKPSLRKQGVREFGVRWTIWVADFKAGRLRALLPSKPMPDKKPLLVWSPDGKRLTCGSQTFVVD